MAWAPPGDTTATCARHHQARTHPASSALCQAQFGHRPHAPKSRTTSAGALSAPRHRTPPRRWRLCHHALSKPPPTAPAEAAFIVSSTGFANARALRDSRARARVPLLVFGPPGAPRDRRAMNVLIGVRQGRNIRLYCRNIRLSQSCTRTCRC